MYIFIFIFKIKAYEEISFMHINQELSYYNNVESKKKVGIESQSEKKNTFNF